MPIQSIIKPKSKRRQRQEMRARAKFWDKWGEAIRLTLIGGGAIIGASLIAKIALG